MLILEIIPPRDSKFSNQDICAGTKKQNIMLSGSFLELILLRLRKLLIQSCPVFPFLKQIARAELDP